MADWQNLFHTGDANCGDSGGKNGQQGGDNHACHEALGEMQHKSQLTSKYFAALNQGTISNVLQDNIRQHVVAALPSEQRQIYDNEQRLYGAQANTEGPAHIMVNRSVQHAETMVLGQAIRQAGLGRVQNVEMAIRLIQNPQAATPQDWVKLGITVGTHGMMPPEVSEKLSRSLTAESTQFFSGTGTGTFSDCQSRLQAEMVSLKPAINRLSNTATEYGQKGKATAIGVGQWFKAKVIDPTKQRINHEGDQ